MIELLAQVGEQWFNEGTCKDCECEAAGTVKCVTRKCPRCSKVLNAFLLILKYNFKSHT